MTRQAPITDLFGIPKSGWRQLYKIGALAALIAVVFFRRNFGAEMDVFNGFGIFPMPDAIPTSALDWFSLFQADPFLGLILFDMVDLINYLLVGVIFLALLGALWEANHSAVMIAALFGWVGTIVFIASHQALGMLFLAEKYALATTAAQKTIYLNAGEALLATHNAGIMQQGTGMHASLFLVLLAGLIFSLVMFRSPDFNTATAVVGLLANGIALVGFIALVAAPEIYWLFPTSSAPFRMIWYVLIVIQLLKVDKKVTLD